MRPTSAALEPRPVEVPVVDITVPPLTLEQEAMIGEELDRELTGEFGVFDDPALERVTAIGRDIVPHTDRPELDYRFTLLDTPEINAMSTPGGFIYVTRGLLDFVGSDDELAGILGHELAHTSLRHGSRAVEVELAALATIEHLAQAGFEVDGLVSDHAAELAAAVTDTLVSGWSQDQEREADAFGVYYTGRAGYRPEAVLDFLERLEALEPAVAEDPLSRLFRTHPPNPERVAAIEQHIVDYCL
jgi:predicted Zn-dependent protease